ncbi:MAG: alpha/beta hydrolase [Lishizhenia sp.]
MKWIFLFCIALFSVFSFGQTIRGLWFANLLIGGQNISLELKVPENIEKSVLTDIRGENRYPIALEEVKLENNQFSFAVSKLGITYTAQLKKDSIIGTFKQGVFDAELLFLREKPEKINILRPQEPKPPFNYLSKDITFENNIGNFTLSGTLSLPKNAISNFPIVILASGSGAQDRNEELLGHKPFLVIADYLSSNGIGVLRFDDRGTGASGGRFEGASIYDFSADLEAALIYIREKYPEHPVGVLGHSEGGMHSLILSERKEIDFLLFFACVGTSGYKVLAQQNYDITEKSVSKEDAKWSKKGIKIVYKEIRKADNYSSAKRILREKLALHYEKASDKLKQQITSRGYTNNLINQLANSYGKEFLCFEAKKYLKNYNGFVFAINGEKDIQVDAKSNLKAFKKHAPKKELFTKEYKGLNHLFQKCETCTIAEYGEIEETFSTQVLKDLVDWIANLPF